MDTYQFMQILNGNFEKITQEKSKTVRIFLSSTFSDTHTERDYLLENIYPRLKNYCKTTYGLEFQILDMRWGIHSEITNSHMTTTICLNEIRTCQKYSVGPNFIALMSHRYGSISLPTRIIKGEYELFSQEMEAYKEILDLSFVYDNIDDPMDSDQKKPQINIKNLFEYCYELDENEIPARYKLKHVDRILNDYDSKNPVYDKIWNQIECKLGDILKTTAKILIGKKLITNTQYERYFVSITEKEIFNGILNCKNAVNNVLVFQRNITDIEEHLGKNEKLVGKFIDLDKHEQLDVSSQSLLNELKNVKIVSKLPKTNIFKFDVKFDSKHGISLKTHQNYIQEFAETFYEQVKRLIDKNQEQKSEYSYLSEEDLKILQEVQDHANFCNETVEKFHGRSDLLDQIKNYLLNDMNSPLILHGESGCGKTAILAKITSEILKIVPNPQNYTIVLRFLGTTPLSSNILNVYNSIAYQISKLFNLKPLEKPILAKTGLRDYLLSLLYSISEKYPNRKIVIVLDSIDQLQTIDYYTPDWLFDMLPTNLKMILSTLPNHGGILDGLKKQENFSDKNFLEIKSLDSSLAKFIIQDWLKKSERSISQSQWQVLDSMFEKNVLYPLYIRIIFDIIIKWTSFYVPDKEFMDANTIDKCIKYLFQSLEKTHGKLLFSRSMIYMTSFKNGISQNEIEDILSLDDEVLYDIFKFHAPISRRLPSALWSRIKHDLKEYMVEKEIFDTHVIYWYHRRFIEVVNSFYISKLNSNQRESIFSNVVDFFNETWKHTPKPYKYNEFLAKKFGLETQDATQIRNTTLQPTVFVDANGNLKYNKRKISELPTFISMLTANLAMPLTCEHVFFNYHFLTGLFAASSFSDIFTNLEMINQRSSYKMDEEALVSFRSLKLISLVFLQCGISMKEYPFSAVTLILYRTLKLYGYMKYFTKLVDEYDRESLKKNALILTHQILEPPGNDLIFQFDKHSYPITHGAIGGDNDSFVFSLSNKLMLFNMTNLKELGEIEINKTGNFTHFFTYFDVQCEKEVSSLKEIQGGFVVGTKNELISYSFDSTLYFVKRFETKTILDIILISPIHILVAFENESYFEIYELKTSKLTNTINCHKVIEKLECNTHKKAINNCELFSGFEVNLIILFEDNTIDFYTIKNSAEENVTAEIEIKKVKTIPDSDAKVVSFRFCHDTYEQLNYEYFVCSFNDGTLFYGKSFENDEIIVIRPKISDFSNAKLVPLDNLAQLNLFLNKTNGHLVFAASKNLFQVLERFVLENPPLIDNNDNSKQIKDDSNSKENNIVKKEEEFNFYIYDIPGSFENGIIINEKKIAGISYGTIIIYAILPIEEYMKDKNSSLNEKDEFYKINLVKLGQIDAHYDQITFLFNKEEMLLTASKDKNLNVFLHSYLGKNKNTKFNFDKSSHKISYLACLDEKHVIAKLQNTNHIDIWNILEGKIVSNLQIKNEIIQDAFVEHGYLVLFINRNNQSNVAKMLNIRVYSYKTDMDDVSGNNIFQNELDISINPQDSYKMLVSNQPTINLFVLTECQKTNVIQLYNINSNEIEEKTRIKKIKFEKCALIKFDSMPIESHKSMIENSCLTSDNNYVVLFTNQTLYYIDSKSGKILAHKTFDHQEIDLNYFLSPTNLLVNSLINLTPIANSNGFIALNNLNELVYFDFNVNGTLKMINNSNQKIHSFKLNVKYNFLIAFNKLGYELIIFDLNVVLKKSSFNCNKAIAFKINLTVDAIDYFDSDTDFKYIYLVEKKKVLKLYTIKTSKKSAKLSGELPMYSDVLHIVSSGDFISIGMQDRKVISFLVADLSDEEKSYEKIRKLPSRAIKSHPETKEKIDSILGHNEKLLESSDDETDEIENELLKNGKDKSEKLKSVVVTEIKNFQVSYQIKKLSELRPFWISKSQKSIIPNTKMNGEFQKGENLDDFEDVTKNLPHTLNLKIELTNHLAKRKNELRTMNTGRNVTCSNQSFSRACIIQ